MEKFVEQATAEYPQYEAKRVQDGRELIFLPWHSVARILNEMLRNGTIEAWNYHINDIQHGHSITVNNNKGVEKKEIVTVKVTLEVVVEGKALVRQGVGYETTTYSGYGDPVSNATAMALRRAAATFGIGLYLYDRDSRGAAPTPSRVWEQQENKPKAEIVVPVGGSFTLAKPSDVISDRSWAFLSKLMCSASLGTDDLEEMVIQHFPDVSALDELNQRHVSRIIDLLLEKEADRANTRSARR